MRAGVNGHGSVAQLGTHNVENALLAFASAGEQPPDEERRVATSLMLLRAQQLVPLFRGRSLAILL